MKASYRLQIIIFFILCGLLNEFWKLFILPKALFILASIESGSRILQYPFSTQCFQSHKEVSYGMLEIYDLYLSF